MDHRSQNVDGILSVASDRDICRLHTTGKRAIVPSQLAGTHDCQRCVVTGFECFNHAQCFQFLQGNEIFREVGELNTFWDVLPLASVAYAVRVYLSVDVSRVGNSRG